MKLKRIILGLLLVIMAGVCHAQKAPPEPTIPVKRTYYLEDSDSALTGKTTTSTVTHTFTAPEIRVDEGFLDSLDIILFNNKGHYRITRDETWRNFHLVFRAKDSLNYYLYVILDEFPSHNSKGFAERDGFLYWFCLDVPLGIIIETKSERPFSYRERITIIRGLDIPPIWDPIEWGLEYNRQTGAIKDPEEYLYEILYKNRP